MPMNYKIIQKTEQESERSLLFNEHEKSIILDNISELVTYQDNQLRVLWANRAAGDSIGVPTKKLIGRYCYEIWHKRNKPCRDCPVIKVYKTGKYHKGEIKTPDGRIWLIQGNPILGEDGKVEGIIEVTKEITENKENEKKILESEKHLKDIVELEPECVKIVAKNGELLDMNPAGLAIIKAKSKTDVYGKSIFDIVYPDDLSIYLKLHKSALKGKSGKAEFRINTFDSQTLHMESHSVPWKDANGKITAVLSVTRDITERRKAEDELKQTIATLKQRNEKLAALNILINELNLLGDNAVKILQKSLDITMNAISADFGVVFLIDKNKNLSKALAHQGLSQRFLNWLNNRYLKIAKTNKDKRWASYQAFLNKRPYLVENVNDVYEGEVLEVLENEGIVSIAAIPFIYQNNCLGIMLIGSKEGKILELFELDFLDSVGKHVGVVIYNKNI